MALELFKNNITTTLAIGINSSATTITVASGDGADFPSLSGGNFFRAVLTSSAVPGSSYEYVIVTAVTGDNLTVIRGQEGVSAASWNAGDILFMTATAASNAGFVQGSDLSGYAPINSPTFTGTPAAPTPAQFDASTAIATAEFVKKEGWHFGSVTNINSATTLTADKLGGVIYVGTGGYTVTLPALSSIDSDAQGQMLRISNITGSSASSITIATTGADPYTDYVSGTSFVLAPGETVDIMFDITSWSVNSFSGRFNFYKNESGYQILPSGLIIQWQRILTPYVANGQATWTFPITFPNATLGLQTSSTINGASPNFYYKCGSTNFTNSQATIQTEFQMYVWCLAYGY